MELGQMMGATRAVEMNEETEADLRYLRGRGTSLGGMRPKCAAESQGRATPRTGAILPPSVVPSQ